jgi:hypothetical protein
VDAGCGCEADVEDDEVVVLTALDDVVRCAGGETIVEMPPICMILPPSSQVDFRPIDYRQELTLCSGPSPRRKVAPQLQYKNEEIAAPACVYK